MIGYIKARSILANFRSKRFITMVWLLFHLWLSGIETGEKSPFDRESHHVAQWQGQSDTNKKTAERVRLSIAFCSTVLSIVRLTDTGV